MRDVTDSLKGFTGVNPKPPEPQGQDSLTDAERHNVSTSDVSDVFFSTSVEFSGKESISEGNKGGVQGDSQKVEEYGPQRVRNVRAVREDSEESPIAEAMFWHLLATWPYAREHPRWKDRPELRRARAWRPPRFGRPDKP